jgi:hypothetical protein
MTAAFDPLLTVYTQTKIIYRFVNVLIYDLFLIVSFEKIVYLEVWFNFCDLLCSAWKFEVVVPESERELSNKFGWNKKSC